MSNWVDLSDQIADFSDKIVHYLEELNILDKVELLQADHLGLRFENVEQIENIKSELLKEGKIISSAVVNGREILIFEMTKPIEFDKWQVECIELPYPKPNQEYMDGWEHVEFVIPSDANTMEEFREDFKDYFSENYDLISREDYSESVPQAESDQLPNPSIVLRKDKNITIKFHPRSIKRVVSEK